ncbi:MAG TPA: DUF3105 domain-containing protein [Micromonosporaceae bacterium]|nr:DUF3105 domain-containing protein [Micromonosporaceae bacterium]
MSISTQGGDQSRRPAVVSTGAKKPASARSGTGAKKPASKDTRAAAAGKGPRKPVTPVKVGHGRNWGPIALFVAVGVLALIIIGYGGYAVFQGSKPWEDRAAGIDGIVDYREKDPKLVEGGQHQKGTISYSVLPPVAGPHNGSWQNCMGEVYDAPIANEHAVHSLEHGAVWVTYRSDLPADQVQQLASKVRGNEYMLMSPIDNLDKPISLQAWGYQLKVDNADDGRIDEFIKALRSNATIEPGATCAQGITATGTTPRDLAPQGANPGAGG